MNFHWSLSDSKSPQVSRTLLGILAVLNNAVVWMVSTRPLTSKSSSPFSNHLVTVPNAPITIGIIVTCMSLLFNFRIYFRFLTIIQHVFTQKQMVETSDYMYSMFSLLSASFGHIFRSILRR